MAFAYAVLSREINGLPAGTIVEIPIPDETSFTGPVQSALKYPVPPTIDPIIWTPTADDNAGDFPSDRDVRIVTPEPITWKNGITAKGGRNVVWLAGEVKLDEKFYDDTQANPAAKRNRGLYIQGGAGSTTDRFWHCEGVKFHGSELYEGINVECLGDVKVTATFQNLWFGRINWRVPPWNPAPGQHDGGDALQPWRGPWNLRVDKFVASECPYQAIFLQPRQFDYTLAEHELEPFGEYEFNNVHLRGVTGSTGQLMAMSGSFPDSDHRKVYNTYIEPGNRSFRQAIKGAWEGLQEGPPPVPFVLPETPGVGYVSPGYI